MQDGEVRRSKRRLCVDGNLVICTLTLGCHVTMSCLQRMRYLDFLILPMLHLWQFMGLPNPILHKHRAFQPFCALPTTGVTEFSNPSRGLDEASIFQG